MTPLNLYFKEKCFPSSWKVSSICPVFKISGERSYASQYRQISLLIVISKVLKYILNVHILNHLSKNNLLADVQYGFRHARSTADVLTVISHRISEALDSTYDARAIALDISKVFDQVWHNGLLHKLSSYGISGRIYSIIKSFLSSRSMKVVVNGQSSKVHAINAGLPQCSVLGPTLFVNLYTFVGADSPLIIRNPNGRKFFG